jgi:hypothetical protein
MDFDKYQFGYAASGPSFAVREAQKKQAQANQQMAAASSQKLTTNDALSYLREVGDGGGGWE